MVLYFQKIILKVANCPTLNSLGMIFLVEKVIGSSYYIWVCFIINFIPSGQILLLTLFRPGQFHTRPYFTSNFIPSRLYFAPALIFLAVTLFRPAQFYTRTYFTSNQIPPAIFHTRSYFTVTCTFCVHVMYKGKPPGGNSLDLLLYFGKTQTIHMGHLNDICTSLTILHKVCRYKMTSHLKHPGGDYVIYEGTGITKTSVNLMD